LRPQTQEAPRLSSQRDELIAFVGLRSESRVTGGLSVLGLANVAVRDWSDDFTFSIGIHCHRCQSSIAQSLAPRVSKLHWIDATSQGLKLKIETNCSVLCWELQEAATLQLIRRTGEHLRKFALLCGIQSSIDLFMLNLATKLQWRESLIACDSCQQLDAAFPQTSTLLRQISAISSVVSAR
jgi:hypothetical protein